MHLQCCSLLSLQQGQPSQTRRVTAELGCVTPYIVCPGQWSQSDLEYHAGTVVAGMTHNAGHNCLKAEVLLLDRDWPQREAFLAALRSVSLDLEGFKGFWKRLISQLCGLA